MRVNAICIAGGIMVAAGWALLLFGASRQVAGSRLDVVNIHTALIATNIIICGVGVSVVGWLSALGLVSLPASASDLGFGAKVPATPTVRETAAAAIPPDDADEVVSTGLAGRVVYQVYASGKAVANTPRGVRYFASVQEMRTALRL